MVKKMQRKFLAVILTLAMAISLMPALASAVPAVSINLGNATTSGGKYYYTDAAVTGDGIRTILISFSDNVISGDAITLPGTTPTGFTVSSSSNAYTKRINLESGISTSAVQSYLREVGFAIASTSQMVSVTVTTESIATDTFYNIDTEHYYQYISDTSSGWITAYNNAHGMTYRAGPDTSRPS